MSKKVAEPGLEVSDFIINTVGRHLRHALKVGKQEPNDMFLATFQHVSQYLST